jgi:prepilin-type N-terminal cleavage/methylation domain-containing protein
MACHNFPCPIPKHYYSDGFTMVETLVAIGLLSIFFSATALILQYVMESVGSSRVRSTALALAEQKMEVVRNLPYSSVGTIGGIPQGALSQTENITINTLVFTIKTSILYYDDPYDGVVPADLIPTDYKRVRIEVTWGGQFPSRTPIDLVTNIVPKGIESVAGGGTLMIQVFNSLGLPVPNSIVKLDNTVVTPNIHMETLSNSDGIVAIPGAPACLSCYQITVTKSNYSTDKTYSTAEVANPLQPYVSIIAGSLTHVSFSIDQVSTIIINSYNQSGSPVANVLFTLRGTKLIGHDTSDNPVYKFSSFTGTGGGTGQIPGLEWDTYTLDFSSSAHTLAGSNPTMPFNLPPSTTLTIPIIVVPKANNSLLIKVKNSSGVLQSSASANLSSAFLGYDTTKTTNATGSADYGQAFFPALSPGAYQLKISLPGYIDATSSFNISTNQQDSITLNPLL